MRTSIAVACLLSCAAPARAASSVGPASLLDHVPDTALLAGVVQSGALALGRAYFAQSPDLQDDMGLYFTKRLGVDLTRVDGIAAWSTQLTPQPSFALFLRLPQSGVPSLTGTQRGSIDGAVLVAFGKNLVAAAVPGGVLIGDEAEVRLGVAVAHQRAPAVGAKSPLAPLLAQARDADLAAGLAASAVHDPQLRAAAATYGVDNVALRFRADGQVVMEISGDAQKLKNTKTLVESGVNAAIALLKVQHDRALADDHIDFAAGLGAVAGYRQLVALWKEFAPRLEGDKLVSRYQMPQLKTSNMIVPLVGIGAAVAIPAFMTYIRRSKTVEASMNVRRLAEGAARLAADQPPKKKSRFAFPKSTAWTPARGCCGRPADKCEPDASLWTDSTFAALGFSVDDPHYYQYRVTSEGRGAAARMTVEARGDLDCDGKPSSWKRVVTVDAQGNPSVGPLQSVDEIE